MHYFGRCLALACSCGRSRIGCFSWLKQWWRKPGEPFIVLGQPHYSDMHLCSRFSSFPVDPACSEFGDPRVNGLPLVHCASERTRVIGLDKVTVMRSIT